MTNAYAASIYKMYRDGIVQGSDSARSCFPDSNILRSEVAAIINPDKRVRFSLTLTPDVPVEPSAPLTIAVQPQTVSASVGDSVFFLVRATGGKEPYTYQWQWQIADDGWVNADASAGYSGYNTPLLTNPSVSQMAFYYLHAVRCSVTDAAGTSVISKAAGYEEITKPAAEFKIKTQPADVTADAYDWVTFSCEVEGGVAPYTYRWCATPGDALTLGAAFELKNGAKIVDTDEIDREYVKAGSVFSLHCEAKGGSGEYTYEWYTVRDKDASKAERIESCYVYEEGTENFSYFANRAFLSDAVEIYCVVSDSAGAKVTTGWIKILEKTN